MQKPVFGSPHPFPRDGGIPYGKHFPTGPPSPRKEVFPSDVFEMKVGPP